MKVLPRFFVLAVALALLPSCAAEDGPLPDFRLQDLNDESPLFGEFVSPRDYLEQISGWYFAHAT